MKEYLNNRKETIIQQFNEALEQNTQAQTVLKNTNEILLQLKGGLSEIEQLIQELEKKENNGGEAID
jgi:F0F1-type ATP synthase membrane subunit b/b'